MISNLTEVEENFVFGKIIVAIFLGCCSLIYLVIIMNIKKLVIQQILIVVVYRLCYCVDILSKFHQTDYTIRNLRVEVQYINKNLMHTLHAIGYKHNRTTTAFNVTCSPKINVEDKLEIVVQAYKRASNEYRLFPMRFQVNACKAIASNAGGLRYITNYGNFTRCYWKKDTLYYARGFTFDDTQLPPLIPTGEYKLVADLIHYKDTLGIINGYAEVIYRRDM